ncbi:Negative regulator of differentiation 1 [Escovopsis weberi]|uniref:Negative regulator of differentiation 1 n=1 Tax=Escovopsis weberi TaxID=150374 RepID=A0A0M8N276_ESCWE|nr:Negative regulator of differentiation 1 [Escovopsis weberi]
MEDTIRYMSGHRGGTTRLHVERVAARSIQFSNLSPDTTHADITAAVRGGALLDIYLRRRDGAASVAFVHGDDAQAFYDHARRNGLFVRDKRAKVKWSDRLYTLPGHLAQKLEAGASRNIVIRRCDASHTEVSIREDLEHIHNLVVVKLLFLDGDCYISTNSVAHAMKYKGSRIEWDSDECAMPLEHVPPFRHRQSGPSPPLRHSAANSMENRFKVLDLDD